MAAYRITLHAHRKARSLGLPIDQVRGIIELDDVCERMPNPTDGRIGKRLYGRVDAREFHIILVVNPGDTLHWQSQPCTRWTARTSRTVEPDGGSDERAATSVRRLHPGRPPR